MPTDPPGPRLVPVPDDGAGSEFTASTIRDSGAERAVLGACMTHPEVIDDCSRTLTGVAFYEPKHAEIWRALLQLHAQGRPVDPIAVLDSIRGRGMFQEGVIDAPYIITCIQSAPAASASAIYHAQIIQRLSRQRGYINASIRLRQVAERESFADPFALDRALIDARTILDDIEPDPIGAEGTLTIDEFLANEKPEDEYDWVIPGLLERHDRVILTGPEGGGKSTLLRQIGVMVAAGLNPFTTEKIPPITVLHVDLENSERQSRRKFRPLRIQATDLDPTHHYIEIRSAGIDLLQLDEQAWLLGIVDKVKPDLLLTGPLYRMATGDPIDEKTAKPVSVALDRIRERGTAIMVEAHTPHAPAPGKPRPHRPYGASMWLRWPEFGLYLAEDGVVHHWRGARDERDWPTILRRGGEWPWTAITDEKEIRWVRIRQAREEFGQHMSIRDVSVATSVPVATLHRIIGTGGSRRRDWETINGLDT